MQFALTRHFGLFLVVVGLGGAAASACSSGGGSSDGAGGGDSEAGVGGEPNKGGDGGSLAAGSGGAGQVGSGGSGTAGAGGTASGGAGTVVTRQGGTAGSPSGGTGGAAVAWQACPATGDCKVLVVGDGIAAGEGSPDGGGFRKYSFATAVKAGKRMTFVGDLSAGPAMAAGVAFPKAHEGRPQAKLDAIATTTAAAVTKHKPHIVLIVGGSEDIRTGTDLLKAPDRLLTIVDATIISAPDAMVLVMTPPAVDPGAAQVKQAQWNYKAWSFEAAVAKGIADRAKNKHVGVIKLWSLLAANMASVPQSATPAEINDKYTSGSIWVYFSKVMETVYYTPNDQSNQTGVSPKGGYEAIAGFVSAYLNKYLK